MPPVPPPKFQSQPPETSLVTLAFPAPHVLLVTLNRPRQLNCINSAGHHELHRVWMWLDEEPSLRVGIVTGAGRAFCAGADLKEWLSSTSRPAEERIPPPPSGFGGLSRRKGRKPVIAAVNGIAHGGGCEMVVNCDIVLASDKASLALPEAKRGVAAIAGALPRLPKIVGRQRAMEMALTGRELSAQGAREWGLVNKVVKEGDVVNEAIAWAEEIAANSPDSLSVSKAGVELAWEGLSAEEATDKLVTGMWKELESGENIREGLRAFVGKRSPRWAASKL